MSRTKVEYDPGFDKVLVGGRAVPAHIVRAIAELEPGGWVKVSATDARTFSVESSVPVEKPKPKKKPKMEKKTLPCVWPPDKATAPFPEQLKDENGKAPGEE